MLALIDRRGWEEITGAACFVALSAARHWPIPYEDCPAWYGLFFDVMQDVGHNPDRAGNRRPHVAKLVTPKAMSDTAGADAR